MVSFNYVPTSAYSSSYMNGSAADVDEIPDDGNTTYIYNSNVLNTAYMWFNLQTPTYSLLVESCVAYIRSRKTGGSSSKTVTSVVYRAGDAYVVVASFNGTVSTSYQTFSNSGGAVDLSGGTGGWVIYAVHATAPIGYQIRTTHLYVRARHKWKHKVMGGTAKKYKPMNQSLVNIQSCAGLV